MEQKYDEFELEGLTMHLAILTDDEEDDAEQEPAAVPSAPEQEPSFAELSPEEDEEDEEPPFLSIGEPPKAWERYAPEPEKEPTQEPLKEEKEPILPETDQREPSYEEEQPEEASSEEGPLYNEEEPQKDGEDDEPETSEEPRAARGEGLFSRAFARMKGAREKQEEPQEPETEESPEPPQPPRRKRPVGVEDVVADTVDAVLEEQQEEKRKPLFAFLQSIKKEKPPRTEQDEEAELFEEEPPHYETTIVQKRLAARLRSRAWIATWLTLLTWVPFLVARFLPAIPYTQYFHYIEGALLILTAFVASPVFIAGFSRRQVNGFTLLSLTTVFTALDALVFLPGRMEAPTYAGIVAIALSLALWGECWKAGALQEGFRLVALGRPAYLVDETRFGAVKSRGTDVSFYHRSMREDISTRWQTLFMPVILAGVVVFSVLSSVGRGRTGDLFWCLSAIGTAACALSLPFAYSLPFYRMARKISRSGGVLAGYYGASRLCRTKEILLKDSDLFPPGTIKLEGVKLVTGDPRKAASYGGTLAKAFDCAWSGVLLNYMKSENFKTVPYDNLHIHEDGGISAAIYGETVILGTAALLRKASVKLPRSLERRDAIYLAVDGELCAIFGLKYRASDGVGWALHTIRRNGLVPFLATKDPNITPQFLKRLFGTDGGSILMDLNDRLNLSRPFEEHPLRPNALLYREGLAPYLEVVAGSKRLTRAVRWGGGLTLLASLSGAMLSYYLIFMERYSSLRPPQLLLFLALWMLPVLILSFNVDKL